MEGKQRSAREAFQKGHEGEGEGEGEEEEEEEEEERSLRCASDNFAGAKLKG
jgi:hypothetical protein